MKITCCDQTMMINRQVKFFSRREFLSHTAVFGAAVSAGLPCSMAQEAAEPASVRCDVFVYGSTPGGSAAAIEAARRGCKVVLACPKNHPGGMAASGLSTTDAVRRELFGGLVAEFIAGVREEYRQTLGENSPDWKLYPKKAFGPAQPGQVPYGAMLPVKLNNLLVPVALSCMHIAMSVLRMEPLWMTTGQIAGLAAAVAKEKSMDAANLDPNPLPKTLGVKVDPYA